MALYRKALFNRNVINYVCVFAGKCAYMVGIACYFAENFIHFFLSSGSYFVIAYGCYGMHCCYANNSI